MLALFQAVGLPLLYRNPFNHIWGNYLVLEQVVAWRGRPQALRLDNGPELIADRFMTWCAERRIELRYIQPGNRIRTPSLNDSIGLIVLKC